MRRIRLWLNNRKNRFQDAVHNELKNQVEGLIIATIDDYLYSNNIRCAWSFAESDGIDANIIDKSLYIEELGIYDDICTLAHLHSDDLLWYILNQEEYNKKIIKSIDNYVKYKKGKLK